MVARNEAERFLPIVLDRLTRFVDLITFTDDASEDNTLEIAQSYGAITQRMDDPMFSTNEGALRWRSWELLSQYANPGDWILAIDADEKLYGLEHLPVLLDRHDVDVLGVLFFHMWNETHYRIDKAWRPSFGSRLFRYYPGGDWNQRKMACGSEPTYVAELIRRGKVIWETGLAMQHLGYTFDGDKIMKYQRYMELDGGDYHARTHIESIMDSSPTLMEWPYGEDA